VIEPINGEIVNLADLVAGITKENRHDAVDTGQSVGREFW
jgi:antitoxin component of MazEF toxin-antitoxin module